MRIRIGIWAGGDPDNSEGTIEWAGGETDYTEGPFSMYVESVDIINYNPAQAYKYTDKTGAYTSIKAINGTNISSNLATSSSTGSVSVRASSTAVGSSSTGVGSSSTGVGSSSTAASSSSSAASAASSAVSSVSFVSGASASYYTSVFVIAAVSLVAGLVQY
jgi:cobalamin biosynthesis Mg chelatase CobN